MCRACDWLVGQFAKGDLEPEVRAAARAGTYQLLYMRVPAYAAVSATVAECPPRARSLLNAVRRKVAGVVDAGPVRWPGPGTKLSYPDWVLQRLGEDLGPERALGALEQMNQAASVSVRADGYTQDPGSQAVGEHMAVILSSAAEGPVLDVCAAPGGKATFLAAGSPLVVAADLGRGRAKLVAGNVGRLQLGNVAVVVADGTAPPFRPASFSGVLVDAPCSGLGVLRRRPDARWRVRPEDVGRLSGLQRRLLAASAPLVRPGGVLVYSVCTLTRAETRGVDEWLAGELPAPEWEVAPVPGAPWDGVGRGALLLPQAAGTDGMYLLALRRRA
jgi:16S rRNA (cytosine967-C5)-methyltransferase